MSQRLFEDFPPISDAEWRAAIERDLKGADYDKTLVKPSEDGFPIRPVYRRSDLPPSEFLSSPWLRRAERQDNDWVIREEIRNEDVAAANAHARRCLDRGANEISVLTYPMGVRIRSQGDIQHFLDGIDMVTTSIHWMAGPLAPKMIALVANEARRRDVPLDAISDSFDLDPITDSAIGWSTASIDEWYEITAPVLDYLGNKMPHCRWLTIRGALFEKAGASVAQELAAVLAILDEYLRGLTHFSPVDILRRTELRLAVGSNYLLNIAQLRALRVLLGRLMEAHGVGREHAPWVHVFTSSSNKTLYDPHNNLLRATLEAMSAVLGGTDSLSVVAYDQGYHTPDEFSAHLARNTKHLLKAEAYLDRVVDPLGGSYAIESLTESIVQAALGMLQGIEATGGFTKSWISGEFPQAIARVRDAKAKAANRRRMAIVGTNVYPNPKETRLDSVGHRTYSPRVRPSANGGIESLADGLREGMTMDAWFENEPLPDSPLNPFRPSWPFEHLRLQLERHQRETGETMTLLLAMVGDRKLSRLRAGFCQGFFGAGGYQTEIKYFSDASSLRNHLNDQRYRAVVLCSSDEEYLAFTQELDPKVLALPVLVAGNPADADALRGAGIWEFVHIRSDAVETLSRLHRHLEISEVTE